jgi:arylsulfatase A-like enzyme
VAAGRLKSPGYETAYIGKWHMGNDDTARPGFDSWVSMKGQGTSFDPVLNVNGSRDKHTGHTTDVLNQPRRHPAAAQRDRRPRRKTGTATKHGGAAAA